MKDVSSRRKICYYFGMGLIGLGFVLFFVPFFCHTPAMFKVGVCGFILIGVGQVVSSIGRFGWAGAGVLLDPRRAREEIEPFSRMQGGVLKDVLDEAGLSDGIKVETSSALKPERVVMIRCRECGALNEEDSKFCRECGKSLL